MAYLDDDFQGYAIGTSVPFGSWTGSGFFVQIQAQPEGTGIPGTDRSFGVFLGTAEYVRAYLSSFSQWIAVRMEDNANAQILLQFTNGPNGFAQSFTLLQFQLEPDTTLTAICPVTGDILANSGNVLMPFGTWHFLQINVTLSDVLLAGVLSIHIDCDVALNGVQIMAISKTVAAGVAQLANSTSEVNRFQLRTGAFGAYTLDVLTALVAYPHGGTPAAIVYQTVVEVDEVLDSGKLDVYQAIAEVDVLPDSALLRVLQMVVEVDTIRRQRAGRAEYIHRRHFPGD